jgi:murein DD-endopeptidase MepM/ murein hydrolase activator NlpD
MRRHHHGAYRKRRGLRAAFAHFFRERQIYLRAEGEVQFITLKPWVQVTGLTALLAGLFWLAFSSINIVFKDQLLALRERGMYEARLEYEDRIAGMRNQVDQLSDRLLINQHEYLGRVDQVKEELNRLVERHKRLVEFFRQGMGRKPAAVSAPAFIEEPPRPTEEVPADSHEDQSGELTDPVKAGFDDGRFAERYRAYFRNAQEAEQPLARLGTFFDAYRNMELALLDEALAQAEAKAQRARAIFKQLGVDEEAVVANSDYQTANSGGPLIAVSFAGDGKEEVIGRMAKVLETYEAYDKLRHEALQLPLAMPVKDIKHVTSGYGIRRDPFRHTIAMHSGVDFKSETNTPVYATADGKVNVAGWEGAYGRLVEILHDNRVATRYAHLSSITVAVGEKVKIGDMVGRLGNTGRSTGPHLHYETRIKGRAVDPVRFWQTSNAVQELSKEE